MPPTLHSDLVRLAKLARVGQADLPESVAACCASAGAGGAAFKPYTAALESLLVGAKVNATAVAEAVNATAVPANGGDAPRSLAGRLLNTGGVAGCKGAYEALLTGDRADLATDGLGAFSVAGPRLARYYFSAALPGSVCKDAVTGVVVRLPMALYVPAVDSTVVNAIALLTVPAAADPTVAALYATTGTATAAAAGRAPPHLWRHAYRLFGYDGPALGVDFLAYVGDALKLGSPTGAAVAGTNAQLMSVLATALELAEPLLGAAASTDAISAAAVASAYAAVNATHAANGTDGSAALSRAQDVAAVYRATYEASLPVARRRAQRRRLQQATTTTAAAPLRTAAELQPLFDGVARTVAGANARVQAVVQQALAAAAAGAPFDAVAAMVQVAAVSAVVQQDLAAGISELAARVAADPAANLAAESARLEADFSGAALDSRVAAAVAADPALADKIKASQAGLGDPAPGAAALAARPNVAGIVAGTVVGFGVLAAATFAAAAYLARRRRHAGGGGDNADGVTGAGVRYQVAGGPVGEAAEEPAAPAQRGRVPRSRASLQRSPATNGGSTSGGRVRK